MVIFNYIINQPLNIRIMMQSTIQTKVQELLDNEVKNIRFIDTTGSVRDRLKKGAYNKLSDLSNEYKFSSENEEYLLESVEDIVNDNVDQPKNYSSQLEISTVFVNQFIKSYNSIAPANGYWVDDLLDENGVLDKEARKTVINIAYNQDIDNGNPMSNYDDVLSIIKLYILGVGNKEK